MVSRKQEDVEVFVGAMYYFLGWMVGDGIKNLGSRRFLTMRFRLQLTRKHPDNLPLGTYVMDCLGMLGVKCVRGRDGRPRKKVPNGFYAWHSSYSPAVWWLFTACLGLSPDQKTTQHPVRMAWLLDAPREMRLWFLRGLADSDGDVHFQHRWVDICTSPNTNFIRRFFGSFGTTHSGEGLSWVWIREHFLPGRRVDPNLQSVFIDIPPDDSRETRLRQSIPKQVAELAQFESGLFGKSWLE
jgi:hypothetical protein